MTSRYKWIVFFLLLFSVSYYFSTAKTTLDEQIAKTYGMELNHLQYEKVYELNLDGAKVKNIENIQKCVNLKYLTITNVDEKFIDNIDGLVNLKTLSLNNGNIQKIPDLSNYPELEVLDLSENHIEIIEYDFKNNPKLKVIRLRDCGLKAGKITSMSIKELNIQGNKLEDLEFINALQSVENVIADGNPITTAKGIENLKSLKSIVLDFKLFDPTEIEKLKKTKTVLFN